MENSINSFTKKKSQYSNSYSSQQHSEEEESGWTGYFEDYSNCSSITSSDFGSSSMVSDAASCAAWKKKNHALVNDDVRLVLEKSCKNLIIFNSNTNNKKRRSRVVDDSLEDTASSPVNSPKVSETRELDVMSSPAKNVYESNIDISQGKRRILSDHCFDMQFKDEKRNAIGNECTELRKRGFCLVPMSMLVNYVAGQN
ncbi:hypothetical protein MKW98_024020 [Papaver atlanticum]|uniref:Uncharacterized protein n=1 Tax=Papaver atlanticum TaxID=357466 RepID=A0AAD4SZW5_9MAGN|nr:hypothetical protein MKW98_024020 [Papaver atlanticum]